MKNTIMTALLGGVLCMVSCESKKTMPAESPGTYPVMTLSPQSAALSIEYPATLEGEQTVEIRSKVDGYIEAVYIEEGALVKKGQPLFKIDANSFQQDVYHKKAAVAAAEASLETASIQAQRTAVLAAQKIVNSFELTAAKNTERMKKAELSQARAELSAAQSKLAFTNIVSPINGVVGSLPFKIGSLVSSTSPNALTTVANTQRIYAYFSLSQQQLNAFLQQYQGNQVHDKFKNMPEVSLILGQGEPYVMKGKIQTLSGVLNASTGSANFKAVFPNPDGLLWSGASATIQIPTQFTAALLIPKKAVFELQGKYFVFTADAANKVHTTEIMIRETATEKDYVIREGLKAGDRIVTEGLGNLRDGMVISPQVSSSK